MFLTCCVRSADGSDALFGEMRLVVDTDRIEALSFDRAALWAAPFLTVNEKRAAVGNAPVRAGGLRTPPEPRTTARCFGMGSVRTPPEGLTGKSPNLRRRGPSVMTFSSPGIRRMPGLFTTVSRFAHAAVAGDLRQLVASWRRKFGEIAGTNE